MEVGKFAPGGEVVNCGRLASQRKLDARCQVGGLGRDYGINPYGAPSRQVRRYQRHENNAHDENP